jgi:hypothetical protein
MLLPGMKMRHRQPNHAEGKDATVLKAGSLKALSIRANW